MKSSNVFSPAMLAASLMLSGVIVADMIGVPTITATSHAATPPTSESEAKAEIEKLFTSYGKLDASFYINRLDSTNYGDVYNEAKAVADLYVAVNSEYQQVWSLFIDPLVAFDGNRTTPAKLKEIRDYIQQNNISNIANTIMGSNATETTAHATLFAKLSAANTQLTSYKAQLNTIAQNSTFNSVVTTFKTWSNGLGISKTVIDAQNDAVIAAMSAKYNADAKIKTAVTDGNLPANTAYDNQVLYSSGKTYLEAANSYLKAYFQLYLDYQTATSTDGKAKYSGVPLYNSWLASVQPTFINWNSDSYVTDTTPFDDLTKSPADTSALTNLQQQHNTWLGIVQLAGGASATTLTDADTIYLSNAQKQEAEKELAGKTTDADKQAVVTRVKEINERQREVWTAYNPYENLVSEITGVNATTNKEFTNAKSALLAANGLGAIGTGGNSDRSANTYNETVKDVDAAQLEKLNAAFATWDGVVTQLINAYYENAKNSLQNRITDTSDTTNVVAQSTYFTNGQIASITAELDVARANRSPGGIRNILDKFGDLGKKQQAAYAQYVFSQKVKASVVYVYSDSAKQQAFDSAVKAVSEYFDRQTSADADNNNKLIMELNGLTSKVNETVLALDGTSSKQAELSDLVDSSLVYRTTTYYLEASVTQRARFDLALNAASTVSNAKFPSVTDIDMVSQELEDSKNQLGANSGNEEGNKSKSFAIIIAIIAFFAAVAVAGMLVAGSGNN
ncbi:MAG: hypothetical protein Q3976_10220 [Corynebacterium sp.]|nr:hypothetical protein [Corynebacterium sp.]